MEDIYDILSKHFLNESSEEEETRISVFRKENPKEYTFLCELWKREGIKIQEFDSRRAWKELAQKINKKPVKTIPLYRNIRNIAAAVALLIIGSFAAIYIVNELRTINLITVVNANTEGTKRIELDDGSVIWLNRYASLEYPDRFANNTRDVVLTGEAYFEVTPDKRHPFIVSGYHSKIVVLGTSFTVTTSALETEVIVRSGKVQVVSDITDDNVILTPNQTAIVTREGIISHETENPNYLSWKTGVFQFNNSPIASVIADLNTYYNNRIELDTTNSYTCNLTATFNQAAFEEVIEVLETACELSIYEENEKFIIK